MKSTLDEKGRFYISEQKSANQIAFGSTFSTRPTQKCNCMYIDKKGERKNFSRRNYTIETTIIGKRPTDSRFNEYNQRSEKKIESILFMN